MAEYIVVDPYKDMQVVGKVSLSSGEAKKRCLAYGPTGLNVCLAPGSGTCDLQENGKCHVQNRAFLTRKGDKVTPIT